MQGSAWLLVAALVFSASGLLWRALRIRSRPALPDAVRPRGSALYGAVYAFGLGMLPWNKESGRLHPAVFWIGVLMHVGIAAALATVAVRLLAGEEPPAWWLAPGGAALGLGAVAGVLLVRRVVSPSMRRLSRLDDYLAAALTAIFCAAAGLWSLGTAPAAAFDVAAAALLVYAPLGKLRHMVTFFIARFYHGEHMGKLGVYRPGARKVFGAMAPGAPIRDGEEAFAKDGEGPSLPVTFEEPERAAFITHLDEGLTRESQAMIDACVHCAMCAEACHYYIATGDRDLIPVAKLDKLVELRRGGSADQEQSMALHEAAYENCSLCGRCALSCPMGINTGQVLGQARAAFARIGKTPQGLDRPAKTAVKTGNYLALEDEDVVENLEWLSEELEDEEIFEGHDVTIPVDLEGAEILYIPHPLELRDFPFAVMAAAKIFLRAGLSFTFSSEHFDVVNYAYYGGDEDRMRQIIERFAATAERLGVRRVVLSPCGHGYKVLRWDAERVLGRRFPFDVVSMAEQIDELLRDGKISVEAGAEKGTLTYHDPCNLGRSGGVIEEPRRIINLLATSFTEMRPGAAQAFCCGGGGGLSASGEYGKTRLTAGRVKARQILETGADTVVTNCFNCNSQIKELTRQHELGVEVKPIHELVADHLVAAR